MSIQSSNASISSSTASPSLIISSTAVGSAIIATWLDSSDMSNDPSGSDKDAPESDDPQAEAKATTIVAAMTNSTQANRFIFKTRLQPKFPVPNHITITLPKMFHCTWSQALPDTLEHCFKFVEKGRQRSATRARNNAHVYIERGSTPVNVSFPLPNPTLTIRSYGRSTTLAYQAFNSL